MSNFSEKNNAVATAIRTLQSGGTVAFPTDTFYALGVDANQENAISKIFKVKQRSANEPVPVLIANHKQAYELVTDFNEQAQMLAERFWPGPLTIVLKAKPDVPHNLNAGSGTVGVRVPYNDMALQLISAFGSGVTGTSANISAQPPMKNADDVRQAIGNKVDFILEGECGQQSVPSTVIDMTKDIPAIVRAGAISPQQISNAIGRITIK